MGLAILGDLETRQALIERTAHSEREFAIISGCLKDEQFLFSCLDLLKDEHFITEGCPEVWRAIRDVHASGEEVGFLSVQGKFKSEAAREMIAELARMPTSIDEGSVEHLVRPLIDGHRLRAIYDELSYITEEILDEEADSSASGLHDRLTNFLHDTFKDERIGGLKNDARSRALAEIQNAYKRGGIDGVKSGFPSIDAITGGFGRSDLIIMAGATSMGKTSLAVNIAENVANAGKNIVFFSCEMSDVQLELRRIASECGVNSAKLRSGNLTQDELDTVFKGVKHSQPNFWIDDTAQVTANNIVNRCKRLASGETIDLVVVDYLQIMGKPKGVQGAYETATELSKGLKRVAKELHVPVIALSQLSRGRMDRENKRPQLHDLRDSGSIEQDADMVLFVHREEYYLQREKPHKRDKETHEQWLTRESEYYERINRWAGKAEVIVAKNRHGSLGTAELGFIGDRTQFVEIDSV